MKFVIVSTVTAHFHCTFLVVFVSVCFSFVSVLFQFCFSFVSALFLHVRHALKPMQICMQPGGSFIR